MEIIERRKEEDGSGASIAKGEYSWEFENRGSSEDNDGCDAMDSYRLFVSGEADQVHSKNEEEAAVDIK